MTFNGKIDQLAYASRSESDTLAIKKSLGLENAVWIEDIVEARGTVFGVPGANKARLLFNYDMGIEVEILQYTEGPNYLDGDNKTGNYVLDRHLAHVGIHWDGEGEMPSFNAPIAQEVWTDSHTNEYLLEQKRKYHYVIFDTFNEKGHYTKVIERIQEPTDV